LVFKRQLNTLENININKEVDKKTIESENLFNTHNLFRRLNKYLKQKLITKENDIPPQSQSKKVVNTNSSLKIKKKEDREKFLNYEITILKPKMQENYNIITNSDVLKTEAIAIENNSDVIDNNNVNSNVSKKSSSSGTLSNFYLKYFLSKRISIDENPIKIEIDRKMKNFKTPFVYGSRSPLTKHILTEINKVENKNKSLSMIIGNQNFDKKMKSEVNKLSRFVQKSEPKLKLVKSLKLREKNSNIENQNLINQNKNQNINGKKKFSYSLPNKYEYLKTIPNSLKEEIKLKLIFHSLSIHFH
jgi:hypothetical protein